MTITGLDNNYYLSQNEIWIGVNGFANETDYLEVVVTNQTTGKVLDELRMSPSPSNEYKFNVCVPVRALFPDPNHVNINSLQLFQIDFKVKYEDTNIPDETISLTKYFIRGGRNKNGNDEWFLTASEELVVGRWIEWNNVILPGYANRIQGTSIVEYVPNNSFYRNIHSNCNYKIVKFLNSLGGYQFYVFEKFEIKNKTKAGKQISQISERLRIDNTKNTGLESSRTIQFTSKTPFEIQSVITDLINSGEVLLFNPSGSDNDSKWERLQLENNDSIENNYDMVYENEIEFSFPEYINRKL